MIYEFTAIPDDEILRAVEPAFQHIVTTYVSEACTMSQPFSQSFLVTNVSETEARRKAHAWERCLPPSRTR
jgi:hypothetical protein